MQHTLKNDKVLNPATGRMVNRNGKVGQMVILNAKNKKYSKAVAQHGSGAEGNSVVPKVILNAKKQNPQRNETNSATTAPSSTEFKALPMHLVNKIVKDLPQMNKAHVRAASKELKEVINVSPPSLQKHINETSGIYIALAKVLRFVNQHFLAELSNFNNQNQKWTKWDLSLSSVSFRPIIVRISNTVSPMDNQTSRVHNYTAIIRGEILCGSDNNKANTAFITASSLEELITKLITPFKDFDGICVDYECAKKEASLILKHNKTETRADTILGAINAFVNINNKNMQVAVLNLPKHSKLAKDWFQSEVEHLLHEFVSIADMALVY